MISFIQGKIDVILKDSVIVNVNGVGYQVFVTDVLSKIDDEIKLYTYMHITESKLSLYGFNSLDEVNFFELLTSVSGIGPKVAMGVLKSIGMQALTTFIFTEDISQIKKAPGIGLKTANRIVLELKDKLSKVVTNFNKTENYKKISSQDNYINDALDALVALGYQSKDVYEIVQKYSSVKSTEEIIKLSLKEL